MNKHDLVIIGGGPGGYVAAIRAAQLGLDVACVEMESALGGTCLRVGCIPSKALLQSSELYHLAQHDLAKHGVNVTDVSLDLTAMMKRKDGVVKTLTRGIDGLFRKNKIKRYTGRGSIPAPGKVRVEGKDACEIEATNIVIATGSRASSLPGIELDGDRVGTSTEALSYPEVPKTLVLIGAGVIGLELGSVWGRLGSQVIVLEYLDRILPGLDAEIAQTAQKLFKKQGLEFRLGTKVTGARATGKTKCVVEAEGMDPITCDRVLVAVGRAPNTNGLGLEELGIKMDRGRVPINDRFETTVKGIYAIGDAVRGPMLAHKAEEEGIACAEIIANGHGHVDYDAIPSIVYTHPEIASVGKSEEELKEAGVDYTKGVFPYAANGRAQSIGETDGKVKVLADAKTDRVLGVHIIGAQAGDLIAEAATSMAFGASSEDIARTCHAHPTLSEAVKEAALDVDGRVLHS
jgi:dihydrolipoamide dehydrogenase